jgi:hypothetical protein
MDIRAPRIAEPCAENWDAMSGDARTRHCARCDLPVTDLSELTGAEVAALLSLRAPGGRLCVRFMPDDGGKVVTKTSQRERLVSVLSVLSRRDRERPPGGEP